MASRAHRSNDVVADDSRAANHGDPHSAQPHQNDEAMTT
jgi:hypothetical protein